MIARVAWWCSWHGWPKEEKNNSITGIGIDENTALCIDSKGIGRVFTETTAARGWCGRCARRIRSSLANRSTSVRVPITGIGTGKHARSEVLRGRAAGISADRGCERRRDQNHSRWPGAHWALAIHGGAGVVEKGDLTPQLEAAYRAGLSCALEAGSTMLRSGGSSLDAVEATIRVLEDDPLFNAGRGAVFTAEGRNELDASIMYGADRQAGAVAGVTRTRNPISLARAVMEQSPHVMLARDGADAFSKEHELEQVDPAYFRTEKRWQELQEWRKEQHLALYRPDASVTAPSVRSRSTSMAISRQAHRPADSRANAGAGSATRP